MDVNVSPAHLSPFGASRRHTGTQAGPCTQPAHPARLGTAQPIPALTPTPGCWCWCWCDQCNQIQVTMPSPLPCVCPREHLQVLCRRGAQTPTGLGGNPNSLPCCLLMWHPSVPVPAPMGSQSRSALGNTEPLSSRLVGLSGSWDGFWVMLAQRLPSAPHGHPLPPVILPRWLGARGTVMLLPHPTGIWDGASRLELPVGNF